MRLQHTIKKNAGILRSHGLEWVYYSRFYSKAILKTGPVTCGTDGPFELHTLVCEKDRLNSLWMLKTFYHFSGIRPKLVIYDDGTLSRTSAGTFRKHFRNCHIIHRNRFHEDMANYLNGHKTSLEYSRKKSFYCALKLFGPMYYAKSESVLYLDSDILFFKKPLEMLNCIENETPFFMSDYQDAYAYKTTLINNLMKITLKNKINAGLFFITRQNYSGSLDIVESYFKKISKLKGKQPPLNHHEQTLVAMLLSKAGGKRLGGDYQISRAPVTDKTISHHFVNDGSRPYFHTRGLKRLKSSGFIEDLSF